jgi:hypothetical protein
MCVFNSLSSVKQTWLPTEQVGSSGNASGLYSGDTGSDLHLHIDYPD